jgi:peptide/nickel transport system permease protein
MWLYAARRLLFTIPIGLGVTIICFALIYLAPGDPVQSLLPPDATAPTSSSETTALRSLRLWAAC